jgi:hypothetical protein
MCDLFSLWLGAIARILRTHRGLVLENLALRQQLGVLKRKHPRPKLGLLDRSFWGLARRFWSRWKELLVLVQPETVARWHRAGFKAYWAMPCKVRNRVGGGLRISNLIRELILESGASSVASLNFGTRANSCCLTKVR